MKKVFGIGVNDIIGGAYLDSYRTWASMLNRCYSQKSQARNPTYNNCIVHEDWHTLSNFHNWYQDHYVPSYQLDKDILIPGNKIYGPDTCIFVPAWVNLFVTDSGASRGKYPVGVSKKGDKFKATIRVNGKKKHLGLYTTPDQAHQAWLTAKRQQVVDRQAELNAIDSRLYQALLARYPVPPAANDLCWLLDAA